jgi:voltage-gated potassium channel
MWWAVMTLTTVGYGDVYPISTTGRVIGAFVAVLGIGLFALPTAILGSGFIEAIQERKRKRVCPHCGQPLE